MAWLQHNPMKLRLRDLFVVALMAAVTLVTAAIYARGVNGPLIYDDYPHLMGFVDRGIIGAGDWEARILSDSGQLKRPVAMASFALNAITSGADFSRWKQTNVMIHLIVGLCVMWLSAALFQTAGTRRDRSWLLGSLVGSVWMLHPLHVSTVLYTVQRMTELSALFTIGGLILYVKGRIRMLAGESGGRARILVAFLVFMPLSCFSKEIGILFPVYCLLVEAIFLGVPVGQQDRRFITAMYFLFLVIPFVAGLIVFGPHTLEQVQSAYRARTFTLDQRLLTEGRVVVSYLGMLLVPLQRSMGFFHDDIQVSTGWMSPPSTALSMLLIAGLVVFAWRIRVHRPIMSFGILFYFVAQILESTAYPLQLMFEHRTYLPSVGIFLAVVDALAMLKMPAIFKWALSAAVLALLTGTLWLRVDTWASPLTLYRYMYVAHPHSDSAVSTFVEFLAEHGAVADGYRILSRQPSAGASFHALYLECRMVHHVEASGFEHAASKIGRVSSIYVATTLIQLGIAGLDQHCDFPPQAYLAAVDKALEGNILQDVVRYRLIFYKAHYLWKLGYGTEAVQTLEDAHRVYPADPMSLLLATEWLIDLKDIERARREFALAKAVAANASFDFSQIVNSIDMMFANGSTSKP